MTQRLTILLGGFVVVACLAFAYFSYASNTVSYDRNGTSTTTPMNDPPAPKYAPLDKAAFDAKMLFLAHRSATSSMATSTASSTIHHLWPVPAVYPANSAALLPFNRIVAYYGNFLSKGMGVLGEYPHDVVVQKLQAAVDEWQEADPATPVVPAIDYIAVTAQGSAGADGKYRARMSDEQIDKAVDMAHEVHGIVILDIQVGLSTVQTEVPLLEKYLKMPDVHLALDPEFSMKDGVPPGDEIGTMSAADINFTTQYLATLVRENDLPPKILVIHRFTEEMLTGYKNIQPLPEVQIIVDMDGWGYPAKKINTYNSVVYPEPIQFTGFKLFYKNDLKPPSTRLLSPAEILKLTPSPSFIQYQ